MTIEIPTRVRIIRHIIAATKERRQSVLINGRMAPATFAVLALDYPVRAGVPDAPLWAAGVPIRRALTGECGEGELLLEFQDGTTRCFDGYASDLLWQ